MSDVVAIVSSSKLFAMETLVNKGFPYPSVLSKSGEEFNAGKGKTEVVPEDHVRIIYDNFGLEGIRGEEYQKLLAEKENFWTASRMEARRKLLKQVGFPLSENEIEVSILASEGEEGINRA